MTFFPFTTVDVGLIVIVAHEQGFFTHFPTLRVFSSLYSSATPIEDAVTSTKFIML